MPLCSQQARLVVRGSSSSILAKERFRLLIQRLVRVKPRNLARLQHNSRRSMRYRSGESRSSINRGGKSKKLRYIAYGCNCVGYARRAPRRACERGERVSR